jgi:hypothetical protein
VLTFTTPAVDARAAPACAGDFAGVVAVVFAAVFVVGFAEAFDATDFGERARLLRLCAGASAHNAKTNTTTTAQSDKERTARRAGRLQSGRARVARSSSLSFTSFDTALLLILPLR